MLTHILRMYVMFFECESSVTPPHPPPHFQHRLILYFEMNQVWAQIFPFVPGGKFFIPSPDLHYITPLSLFGVLYISALVHHPLTSPRSCTNEHAHVRAVTSGDILHSLRVSDRCNKYVF